MPAHYSRKDSKFDAEFKEIGAEIRRLRQKKKWNLEGLAHFGSVGYSFLNDVEKGKRNFSLAVLFDLSLALNTTPDRILKSALAKSHFGRLGSPDA